MSGDKRLPSEFITFILAKNKSTGLAEDGRIVVFESKRMATIGEGAFGCVMKIEQGNAVYAVKVPKSGTSLNDEINIMKTIPGHPNIIQVLGESEHSPTMFLMDYCQDGSLEHYIKTATEIDLLDLLPIFLGVSSGLLHLHCQNIVHRDIARRNVLLSNGIPKIGDFGLAKKLDNGEYICDNNELLPKELIPPNSIGLTKVVYTSKSDVWAFGLLVFTCLDTSRLKIPSEDELIASFLFQKDINNLCEDMDVDICDIIVGCLKTEDKERYSSEEVNNRLVARSRYNPEES